ncbi:hypothetical protein MAR_014786 [Mya arenaria]|uniref:Uncharacterized protein n=1 Tax=Mya arenaria TaxID=6604 RepID=A0ABY7FFA5_MYAAR|nr:hypothetical protein MAR_014786 [Mya arenaria]
MALEEKLEEFEEAYRRKIKGDNEHKTETTCTILVKHCDNEKEKQMSRAVVNLFNKGPDCSCENCQNVVEAVEAMRTTDYGEIIERMLENDSSIGNVEGQTDPDPVRDENTAQPDKDELDSGLEHENNDDDPSFCKSMEDYIEAPTPSTGETFEATSASELQKQMLQRGTHSGHLIDGGSDIENLKDLNIRPERMTLVKDITAPKKVVFMARTGVLIKQHADRFKRYLPQYQIVGLTASIGIGPSRTVEEAVDYILHLCAKLDTPILSTVERCKANLIKWINIPKTDMAFSQPDLTDLMMKKRPAEKESQAYNKWTVDLEKAAQLNVTDHDTARDISSCAHVQRNLSSRAKEKETENPNVKIVSDQLRQMIQEQKDDPRAIVFVKARATCRALAEYIDRDLRDMGVRASPLHGQQTRGADQGRSRNKGATHVIVGGDKQVEQEMVNAYKANLMYKAMDEFKRLNPKTIGYKVAIYQREEMQKHRYKMEYEKANKSKMSEDDLEILCRRCNTKTK